jgi:type IV pilus assembly protein PilA
MATNEKLALMSLRLLNTAEITYASMYDGGYSANLASLGPPTNGQTTNAQAAGFIDEVLASGTGSGYRFTYVAGERTKPRYSWMGGRIDTYTIHADPLTPGSTGLKHFFTDQSGVIREEMDKPATEHSPPLSM